MKHELNEIIAGMNSRLSDDESFMSELEARMDFVDRVKERNERLASKARKMVLRSILLGLLGAALILLGVPGAVTDLLEGYEASLLGRTEAGLRGGTEASLQGGTETSLRGEREESLRGGTEESLRGEREAEALFEESGAEAGLQGGREASLQGEREAEALFEESGAESG
ncbi:MAG: hypothetical protein KIG45_07105, partial [Bacteroidales bacterium]|nr:hypothetical protein [Bacteroidales bacterium]